MMFSSIFSIQAEDNLRKKCKEEEIPAGEYGKIEEKQQRSGTCRSGERGAYFSELLLEKRDSSEIDSKSLVNFQTN